MYKDVLHPQTNRDAFLDAMSRVAATVSILSTSGTGGIGGVTVSSLTSVSADTSHPTILTCLHSAGTAASMILANQTFCANVLSKTHKQFAEFFAGRTKLPSTERFSSVDWTKTESGQPLLKTAAVALDCRITKSDLIGQHHIIFAEVTGIYLGNIASSLIYANRQYGVVTSIENNRSRAAA